MGVILPMAGPILEGPRRHNRYHQATDLDTTLFFFIFRLARAANRRFFDDFAWPGLQIGGFRPRFGDLACKNEEIVVISLKIQLF